MILERLVHFKNNLIIPIRMFIPKTIKPLSEDKFSLNFAFMDATIHVWYKITLK